MRCFAWSLLSHSGLILLLVNFFCVIQWLESRSEPSQVIILKVQVTVGSVKSRFISISLNKNFKF